MLVKGKRKLERLEIMTHLQPPATWPTEDSGRASPLPLEQGKGKLRILEGEGMME